MTITVDMMRAEFKEQMDTDKDVVLVPGRRSAKDRDVEPGTPDYYVTGVGVQPCAVLFVRSVPGARPTARQTDMMQRLKQAGWRPIIAYSVIEAVAEIWGAG